MSKSPLLATICSLLLLLTLSSLSPSQARLVKVVQLIRHGNAGSLVNLNPDLQRNGPGHLTESGMYQQYLVGLVMRKRYLENGNYTHFLNKTLLKKQVKVSTTNLQRTTSSA